MEYTHTYRNIKKREVKCFIIDNKKRVEFLSRTQQDFHVIVTNENGADVYLKYSKLTKIK